MIIIKDIPTRKMNSAYLECPFDQGKKLLEEKGYQIPSLAQNAKLRIQEGRKSYVSNSDNWVREGILYIKGNGKYLTLDSPIMDNPIEATRANREGRYYPLTDNQIQKALIKSIKLPDLIKPIPISRLEEEGLTKFIFGDIAEDYGYFLKQSGIRGILISTKERWDYKEQEIWEKSFVTPIIFERINNSIIRANFGSLASNDVLVRGIS